MLYLAADSVNEGEYGIAKLWEIMLAELKLLANKRDVPYQSLIKIFLAERLEKELESQES